MTIDEAIAHAQQAADTRTDLCDKCRKEHGQLAQWLTELKQLRDSLEKQKLINYELVDENQELVNENKELKRLLRLAVEDIKKVSDDNCCYHCIYGNPITRRCEEYKGNENCYKWQHAEEAMKLLGDDADD